MQIGVCRGNQGKEKSEINVGLETQQYRNFVTSKIPTNVKTNATVTPYILVDTVCENISGKKLQRPR